MKVKPIKTKRIAGSQKIEAIIDKYVKKIEENSILAVTSKIVSICEGSVVSKQKNKDRLIRKEADLFLNKQNKYGTTLTIKNDVLIPAAGIDESNANDKYILWPKDPQGSANKIRTMICEKLGVKNFGVIITDSKTTPLRWGTTGIAIAYSGFKPLNDYIGKADLFGRTLKMTKSNIADGLAAAAVLVMGEGNEQTPLVLIYDIPFVKFNNSDPTELELAELSIDIQDDIYGEILGSVDWRSERDLTK